MRLQHWGLRPVLLACFMLSVLPASAETLSLESVTQQAVERSFALKIAHLDIQIGKSGERIVKADYFPTIKANFNTEYLKDLAQTPQPVVAVGSSIIPSGTRYQNSLGISSQATILDFGVRQRRLRIAQAETQAKGAAYFQAFRDLRLKLVDLYAEALISYRQMQGQSQLLKLAQQGYQLKKRLYEAGTQSRVEVAQEAVQVAQALDAIQGHRAQLAEQLQQLSYFTQTDYDAEAVTLSDFAGDPEGQTLTVSLTHSPEAQQYDAQIRAKQAEMELLRRQSLPQVSLYSYYNLYGFDPDGPGKAITGLSQRTVSLGLNVALPLFDGFKNRGQLQKAQLEQEKLRLQKAEKLAQLKQQADLYQTQVSGRLVSLKTKVIVLNSAQDKLQLVERLTENQVVDATQEIQAQLHRGQQQMAAEKALIEQMAALKKLQILAEG